MTDTPKKKPLSLQRKLQPPQEKDGKPRKRSGARARYVAQQTLTKQKYAAPPAATADNKKTIAVPAPKARPKPVPKQAQIFQVFVPCPHGLELLLSLELQALGLDTAEPGRAGCRLRTDWTGVMRVNLFSRLATRVLVQLSHAPIHHEDDIYDLAYHTPWERWFGAEQTLRVDTSAIRSPMKSLQFCNLRTKDGICDRLRDQEGERPSIDTVRPDARVHLFLDETSATLYLDTSGESLFKRGWRLDKGEAPIRENLAAGLLALSGWPSDAALLDPFCGSGTIMIEAAWIALGVPPGIWRPFAFERLRDHPFRHWRDIRDEARNAIRTRLDTPLVGTDIDPQAIVAAKQNQERARLAPDTIRFEVADARAVPPPSETGWLVTNPPYGERLPDETLTLWQEWASNLKQHYDSWHVHIISSDFSLPQNMRLKPLKRYPIHNGALDCRLFSFDIVKSQYRT
ncbi:MAG: class I SAM-dependent RNA methyltransferase [Pusillimonas sp.]|nr:class I SAM-dependent RNA methyltransferase [Pusillimonas sp.]